MLVMDADNLTYRERLTLPENLVGRAVLNKAATVMYAMSDSGVTVLPVGSLNSYNRVEPGQEDVLIQTSFCNEAQVSQTFTLADPGGNHTDFELTPGAGILVSPSSGVTPATITVSADPTYFKSALGTSVVPVTISSVSAVNQPIPVRVLVSNPDEDQRGTVVDVPGVLSDIIRRCRPQPFLYCSPGPEQGAGLRRRHQPVACQPADCDDTVRHGDHAGPDTPPGGQQRFQPGECI